MIYISHRGNINGSRPKQENKIEYIENAIKLKYEVEIDIFYYKKNFWLGHDKPTDKILNFKKFLNKKFWIHAKNIEAAYELNKIKNINYFWHQNDDITLTSKQFLWTFPGKELTKKSICVMPEIDKKMNIKRLKTCYGICSDYIEKYKYQLNK